MVSTFQLTRTASLTGAPEAQKGSPREKSQNFTTKTGYPHPQKLSQCAGKNPVASRQRTLPDMVSSKVFCFQNDNNKLRHKSTESRLNRYRFD
jgi:hypothetical protein